MGFDIFLSHQGMDKSKIIQLADYLEPDISCWYAPRNIDEGIYGVKVLEGIEKAKVFLVLLTDNFEDDPENYVINEVYHARNCKKRIIPVLMDRTDYPRELEMHLNSYQWLNIDDFPTLEEAFAEVKRIIQLLLNEEENDEDTDAILRQMKTSSQAPSGFSTISDALIEKYLHVFVPSDDFSKLETKSPIHVFYGDETREITTSAVNFLKKSNKDPVFEGLSLDALTSLSTGIIQEQAGYIVHLETSHLEQFLTESQLEQLKARLENKNAQLILSTDSPVSFFDSFQVSLPDDKITYIYNQLSWLEKDEQKLSRTKRLLSLLEENLPIYGIQKTETLFEIIHEIRKTLNDEQTDKELLTTTELIIADQAALPLRLDEEDNLQDILYNLAISLNHGESFDKIGETYRFLLSEFNTLYPEQQLATQMRSFSKLQADYQLKTVEKQGNTYLGSFQQKGIFYQHEFMANKIWPTVWDEYPYKDFLSHVLLNYVLKNKPANNTSRVEDIILSIINNRFEQGIEYFISPLAKSKRIKDNLLAKRLILKTYDEQDEKLKILRLLRNWLAVQNRHLERTALLVLSSNIGFTNYQTTVNWIMDVLEKNEQVPEQVYYTLAFLGKYVYLNPSLEAIFYQTLKDRLIAWREESYYNDFLELIANLMENYPDMFFATTSDYVGSFLIYIFTYMVKQDDFNVPASVIRQYLRVVNEQPNHMDRFKSLLAQLNEKLEKYEFNHLMEKVKEDDRHVFGVQ